jgi:glycosyltransferase involved in cell wall biosynthesis
MIIDMLRPCELVIQHAANHAEWLRERGVTQTRYLPNPVLDGAPELAGGAMAAAAAPPGKPRFVMLGYLEGIATIAGLHLFADEILPELERLLGPNGFQIDVVGKGELPSRVASRVARPSVRLMGFVPDVRAALTTCQALLVPTPIELGFRTRIAEAFSYGACVVAHTANRQGMREIAHGENALLSATGVGLARELVRVAEDPALGARLRRGARATYERELDGARLCRTVVSWMEELASDRLRRPVVVAAGGSC